VKKTHQTFG